MDFELGGCYGVAISNQGSVWSWGSNTSGELGLGDFEARSFPALIESLQGRNIIKVFCGTSSAFAIGMKNLEENKRKMITSPKNRSGIICHIPGKNEERMFSTMSPYQEMTCPLSGGKVLNTVCVSFVFLLELIFN